MTEEETMTEDEKEDALGRIIKLKNQVSLMIQVLESQFNHLNTKVESSGIQIENLELALAGQPLKEEPVNWRMVPTQWSIFEEE